jgi:hypothetical protein
VEAAVDELGEVGIARDRGAVPALRCSSAVRRVRKVRFGS